jgi:YihY family inner membrane protein
MATTRLRQRDLRSNQCVVGVVRQRRIGRVATDAIRRFTDSDGTSHTRALAYQMFLMVLSGFIGLVGLASQLHTPELRAVVEHLATRLAPGPSGGLLKEAAQQGAQGGITAMLVGLVATVVTGALAMAQIQRSANRLFGLEGDRPPIRRFSLALLLLFSTGVLLALGGLLVGSGVAISKGFGLSGGTNTFFDIVRWIVGPLMVLGGTWLLFRLAPREGWTSGTGHAVGVLVAVALWIVFTLALAFDLSTTTSSRTYGPLLAVVGLALWSGLSALALHLGLAVSAELAAEGGAAERGQLS